MIVQQMGYAIQCDYPGCDANTQDLGEYAFWGTLGDAIEEWQSSDWYYGEGDRAACGEHIIWNPDDDGDEVIIPLEPGLEAEFFLANRRTQRRIDASVQRAEGRLYQITVDAKNNDYRIERERTKPIVEENMRWLETVRMARHMGLPYEFFGI